MNHKLKISIITSTYNSESTLEQTFHSLYEQAYSNLEHIIIDGGSTDSTIKIIEKFKNANTIFISEPDDGVYDAFNKGLAEATGDIVGFLHSDDMFASSDVLSSIAEEFEKNNVDFIYGDLCIIKRNDENSIIRYWKSEPYVDGMLNNGWMPPHPTLFIKNAVYKKLGLYDKSYNISADYLFIINLFQAPNLEFSYMNKIITKQRVGGVSSRNLKSIILKSSEDLNIIRKNSLGGISVLIKKNFYKLRQLIIKPELK